MPGMLDMLADAAGDGEVAGDPVLAGVVPAGVTPAFVMFRISIVPSPSSVM
jgi:hypothetical protein